MNSVNMNSSNMNIKNIVNSVCVFNDIFTKNNNFKEHYRDEQ